MTVPVAAAVSRYQTSALVPAAPQEAAKIILLTDVTETRALQELVTRHQRLSAIGKMAASLAHQIRTPLAGALLYFSQCRTRRDDEQRSVLLEKGIDRLRHPVHQPGEIIFARLGGGALQNRPESGIVGRR